MATPQPSEQTADSLHLNQPDAFTKLINKAEHFAKKNIDTARIFARRALEMARNTGDSNHVAKSMNAFALIETYGGNFSRAENFCNYGISLTDSLTNPTVLADLYNTLAKNLKSQQKYNGAMDYYLRSLTIRKKTNDTTAIIGTLINIGGLNSSMKKYEIGLNYYLEAEKLAKHTTHKEAKGSLYNNIAIVYRKLGDDQGALEYYNRALQIYKSINWEYGQAYVLGNIGVLFENSETSGDSALHYYNRALNIHKKLKDHYGIGITKINIALVLTQKKMFSKAEKNFHESISIAKKIKSSRLTEYAYEGLADLEEKRGNFRNAYQYYKKNREIVDSVYNAKKHQQIAELETKYQTERKNKEISLLQKNAKIRELTLKEQSQKIKINQLLIILLIAIIVLGAILIIVLLKLNKTRHMNTKNKLEIKNLRTEQKMLKSQMNPHFVFNSLNSIQSYISSNQTHEASKYLSNFAKLIRGFLEHSRAESVILERELELLKIYIELEQVRYDHKFQFKCTIADNVEADFISIPTMIMQPFVENSIIHGFKNRKNGLIHIDIQMENEYLICVIDDNGIGRKAAEKLDTDDKRESLALKITKKRLSVINEQHGTNANFKIIDKSDKQKQNSSGTKVIVRLPILD